MSSVSDAMYGEISLRRILTGFVFQTGGGQGATILKHHCCSNVKKTHFIKQALLEAPPVAVAACAHTRALGSCAAAEMTGFSGGLTASDLLSASAGTLSVFPPPPRPVRPQLPLAKLQLPPLRQPPPPPLTRRRHHRPRPRRRRPARTVIGLPLVTRILQR